MIYLCFVWNISLHIYRTNQPNIGKYTIHWWYGMCRNMYCSHTSIDIHSIYITMCHIFEFVPPPTASSVVPDQTFLSLRDILWGNPILGIPQQGMWYIYIYLFTDRFNGMIHYIELSIGRPRHQHIATSNIKIGYTLGRKEGHFILEGTTPMI